MKSPIAMLAIRRRFTAVGVFLGVVCATACVGFAAATSATPNVSTISEESGLSALTSPREQDDRLPEHVNAGQQGEGGLITSSVRLLGHDVRGRYYISIDAAGDVCLTVSLNGTANSATVCGSPQQAAEGALGLAAYGPGKNPSWTEAYLLPDGVRAFGAPQELERLTENLLVGDTRAVAGEARHVSLGASDSHPTAPRRDLELIPPLSFD